MRENEILISAIRAAVKAGVEIMHVYKLNFSVEYKADNSPLTIADKAAHQVITEILSSTGIPVLSEEGKKIPFPERKAWKRFWLVDPLDGTKEFIKRNSDFTVNIALMDENKPVMGIIYVPVSGMLYFASKSAGAYRILLSDNDSFDPEQLKERATALPMPQPKRNYTVVASRSHLSEETVNYIDELKKEIPDIDFVSVGSSLKLCLIAEGKADLYPRFGPTMEWDTAAGHALVEISGGYIKKADTGEPLEYNKENLMNPRFIVGRK
ncbi:MAG: 3'(2'),5'-bisphosphate nucleotidase CysQ [Bacteroidales bacterium]|nr:3'(2'),5'-bisphosphate nucleotidase CysQ [Bacteroidales bacterium]